MLRVLVLILLVTLALVIGAVFAWLNPGSISLDLAFGKVDLLKSQAFVGALALGWLLGLLSAGGYVLKLMNDRRRLKKSIRLAQTEVTNLRSLPMQDAG